MSIKSFNINRRIDKAVMDYMKNDPEIKEQAEKLQFLIIRKYMKDRNIEW